MKTLSNRGLALVLALLLALSGIGALAATSNGKTVAIDEKNFPDEAFRAYVQKKFDKDGNNRLDAAEIKKVTNINLDENEDITSLKGVEFFTALKQLHCWRMLIKELDVSKNTQLRKLDVAETVLLKKLKLGKLNKLAALHTEYSKLKSIDIGGCPKLLQGVQGRYEIEDEMIIWPISKESSLIIDVDQSLTNGKKLLRKYAKPKSVKFTNSAVNLQRSKDYDLIDYIRIEPATAVYPIKFTSNNKSVAAVHDGCLVTTSKKGSATITAKVDGKKVSTMKVTTK